MKTTNSSVPILVNPSVADSQGVAYARLSLPLPRGAHRQPPPVALVDPKGRPVPLQSELLARWHDGSARMLHVTFPAAGGTYLARIGDRSRPAVPKSAIRVQRQAGMVLVTTGRLSARLGGPGLVSAVRLGDQEMIGPGGVEVRVLDGAGRAFTATACRQVATEVEVEGPLRTVIALRGKCTLERETFLDFRLRFEFLAGVEGFSLSYAFFNREVGRDFFVVRGIELVLRLADASHPLHTVYQQSYGLYSTLGRVVTTAEPLDVRVDNTKALAYVRNHEALGDEHNYPFYLNPPCNRVDNWAVVSDEGRALQVEMDDFHLLRPKSLELVGNEARFGIWPTWAGPLDLQQGRSRQVTIRVTLSDGGAPLRQAEAVMASVRLRDVWRAQLPQQAYAEAEFFDQARVLPCAPGRNPRFEQWLARMASGLGTLATFFDLGDTPDSGYQSTYIPIGGRIRRVRGEDGGVRYFSAAMHNPAHPLNGLEDFEPVWINNEYDVIYCLGTEYLRTMDLSLFQKLRWFARHNIEVDFVHYSDHRWLNRATPAHSERHTSTGAYPSHFWTQGLAQYYLLTADPDAREVIVALAEKTIEHLEDPIMQKICSGLNREIGWGILTMICAYEVTGIKRFDSYARTLLDREIRCGLPADLPVFSFGHTSILLGARQYLEVHKGDPRVEPVRKWFLDFVDLAIRCSRQEPSAAERPDVQDGTQAMSLLSYDVDWKQRGAVFSRGLTRSGIFGTHSLALDPIAYAYEVTRDPKYIEAGMRSVEALLDTPTFHAPVPEGKPFAMVYRTFINFLKAAAELGHLEKLGYKN